MVWHLTPDQKVLGSSPSWVNSISFLLLMQISQDGRVVKALDLRSNGFLNRVGSNPALDIFIKQKVPQPGLEPG